MKNVDISQVDFKTLNDILYAYSVDETLDCCEKLRKYIVDGLSTPLN